MSGSPRGSVNLTRQPRAQRRLLGLSVVMMILPLCLPAAHVEAAASESRLSQADAARERIHVSGSSATGELVSQPSRTPSPSRPVSRQDDSGVSGFQWFMTGVFGLMLLALAIAGRRVAPPPDDRGDNHSG